MNMELIPVSYLNAYSYCPRRFFLEHNRGMFEDNAHTAEGRSLHRVVDAGETPRPSKKNDLIHRRSVSLGSERLGITGKLDLMEEKEGEGSYPVEYKKGKKPKNREPWPNDKIQLCAQALLMKESGLALPEKGYLYYISSKARVEIIFEADLIRETERTIAECRLLSGQDTPPPLADNRNKCFGCSLNAICLPEEEEVSRGRKTNAREILPSSLDGDTIYVDRPGATIGVSEESLRIRDTDGNETLRAIGKTREVILCGPVQASTQAIHACMRQGIPVHYLSYAGRYVGSALPPMHYHGLLRQAQWRAHFNPGQSLELAREIVVSKILNMKTLLMRYIRDQREKTDEVIIRNLKQLKSQAEQAEGIDTLRGYEGVAAKDYFSRFSDFIKPERQLLFAFNGRNRRPPKDPVNALLSFGYSLLAKDCAGTATRVGFDPYCGFYHSMKYGRPALALDLMELFRQPIVDSAVLTAINNGVFKENDFYRFQGTCYLNEKGRKKYLVNYEMRKKDLITHPRFHYRLSYARTIELQYRLLGKYLLNEIDDYVGFFIR